MRKLDYYIMLKNAKSFVKVLNFDKANTLKVAET